jgi:hypothetical protein
MRLRPARRLLSVCIFGAGVAAILAAGTPNSPEPAAAAEGFETYVACGLTRDAVPSHVCHLSEGREFGAFFRSPTETTYTVCAEFPTGRQLCAEEQTALPETLYVNKITSTLPGLHRITWSVGGQQVGSWEFRIPVDSPVFGKTGTAVPVSGTVLLKGPGEKSFSQLEATGTILAGTLLDTARGTVRLITATGAGRGSGRSEPAVESGLFHAGVFRFTQKLAPSRLKGGRRIGFTVLRLIDSAPNRCAAGRRAARNSRAHHHDGGRLWGNAHGNYQSEGHDATVTVRGTKWLTEDTCRGTRVKVARGVVSVRDIPHHRTVLVKAPHSYLAHAGGRRVGPG